MNKEDKELFYKKTLMLFENDFISDDTLHYICIKNNSETEKILEIKEWLEDEKDYSKFTPKEKNKLNTIYKKICKELASKQEDN